MANETKKTRGSETTGDVKDLLYRKLDMITQVRQLQAEIWKLNTQLQRAGANIDQIACW
ncbi:MAG TPA: hypothetical protein VHG28_15635 [Longimicrobiaceae bacterium]|nr:hypothetical protein [Longimicrobiaceae bacterium]